MEIGLPTKHTRSIKQCCDHLACQGYRLPLQRLQRPLAAWNGGQFPRSSRRETSLPVLRLDKIKAPVVNKSNLEQPMALSAALCIWRTRTQTRTFVIGLKVNVCYVHVNVFYEGSNCSQVEMSPHNLGDLHILHGWVAKVFTLTYPCSRCWSPWCLRGPTKSNTNCHKREHAERQYRSLRTRFTACRMASPFKQFPSTHSTVKF